MKLRVYQDEKLRDLGISFQAPRRGDAGYDLFAVAEYALPPGQRAIIDTGLHLEIPPGHVGLIKDRSSLAAAGIHTLAGVIDSAYRGELRVLLVNLGGETFTLRPGQRIAQLILIPVIAPEVELTQSLADLSATPRGEGGFGSTGE